MAMIRALSCAALAVLCHTAASQGTISDQQVQFTINSIPAQPMSVPPGVDFTADPAGASPDTLFEHGFYYRLPGDNFEQAFNDRGGQLQQQYCGDKAFLRWDDVDFRNLFRALWTLQVRATGPQNGQVVSRMTLQNISPMPIQMELFAYVDPDVCVPSPNNDRPAGKYPDINNADRQIVSGPPGPPPCPDLLEIWSSAPEAFEVQPFPALQQALADPQVTNLANAGLPALGIDVTTAVQWTNVQIAPQEIVTFDVVIGHNHSPRQIEEVFDSSARLTVDTIPPSAMMPLDLAGPVKVLRDTDCVFNSMTNEWETRTNMVSALLAGSSPISGEPLQVLWGDFFGHPAPGMLRQPPTGMPGQPPRIRPGTPAVGEFNVDWMLRMRSDGDLKPDMGPIGVTNVMVSTVPPYGSDYAPTVVSRTTFTSACSGKMGSIEVTVHSRHRPVEPRPPALPTLERSLSRIHITGNANAAGRVRLCLDVAAGEKNGGCRVACSAWETVMPGQTPAMTAALIAPSLQTALTMSRPCCPCTVTASGDDIFVECMSIERLTCVIERETPFASVDLQRATATYFGQTYDKSHLRRLESFCGPCGRGAVLEVIGQGGFDSRGSQCRLRTEQCPTIAQGLSYVVEVNASETAPFALFGFAFNLLGSPVTFPNVAGELLLPLSQIVIAPPSNNFPGGVRHNFFVPPLPGILGATLFTQAGAFVTGAGGEAVVLSDVVVATIGK